MGAKANRLARLSAAHPVCYFCATRATESEDHVPSRECFRLRIGPEGFAFPACKNCNNSAGQMEQVVALYILMADWSDDVVDVGDQMRRLANGVHNNNPDMLPEVKFGANFARKHFRQKGIALAPGQTYGQAPIAILPAGHGSAFELFVRRLACALFYKEVGRPVPLDYYIAGTWIPWSEAGVGEGVANAIGFFPELRVTNRRNTDIGDQFTYKWGADSEGTVFGFVAQFSKSYFFLGAVAAPHLHPIGKEGHPSWRRHSEDVALG
ncbi:hypothetical protein NF701_04970 [Sphingomonadaceae bacterium OTU29THOMA1]|nr:hypothetical protein NF701_04970 [Sphingomonadaceae bacterium OTU29THOMA1]